MPNLNCNFNGQAYSISASEAVFDYLTRKIKLDGTPSPAVMNQWLIEAKGWEGDGVLGMKISHIATRQYWRDVREGKRPKPRHGGGTPRKAKVIESINPLLPKKGTRMEINGALIEKAAKGAKPPTRRSLAPAPEPSSTHTPPPEAFDIDPLTLRMGLLAIGLNLGMKAAEISEDPRKALTDMIIKSSGVR